MWTWNRCVLFTFASLCILSCSSSKILTTDRSLPLSVEYSGCNAIIAGPVCVLEKKRSILKVWFRTRLGAKFKFKGRYRKLAEPVFTGGGKRFEIEIDEGADSLELHVKKGSSESQWKLSFSWQTLPDWFYQVDRLRLAGKFSDARKILKEAETQKRQYQGLVYTVLARLSYYEGKIKEAESWYTKAIQQHSESKYLSHQCRDASALAFLYVRQGRRFDEAKQLMLSNRPPKGFADSIVDHASVNANIAEEMGDFRMAGRQYSRAIGSAKRLGLACQSQLEFNQASSWMMSGRRAEATKSFEKMLQDLDTPAGRRARGNESLACRRARLLWSIVWSKTLSYEARENVKVAPLAQIKEGLELLKENRCSGADSIRFDLQYFHHVILLHFGDMGSVESNLASLRKSPKRTISNEMRMRELEARTSFAAGNAKSAELLYRKLIDISRSTNDPIAEWRSTVGVAQALAATKYFDAAIETYEQANQLSRKSTLQIAIGDGRAAFLAQRAGAFLQHIELLVQLGRNAEALAVARRYRIQELGSIHRSDRLANLPPEQQVRWNKLMSQYHLERDRLTQEVTQEWKLSEGQLIQSRQAHLQDRLKLRHILDQAYLLIPSDESSGILATPGKAELFLLYVPTPTKWIGFAADGESIEVKELEPIQLHADSLHAKNQIAEKLLNPFAEKINQNKIISILSTSQLQSIDFHALPWSGDVLAARKQVRYRLDLANKQSSIRDKKTKRKALLVIDPESNLPKARQEIAEIETAIKSSGDWEVITLMGDHATRSIVWQELQRADWFHFAGHAEYGDQRGWNSALRLAQGTRLEIADLLSIEHAPETVVLLGCETGLGHAESGSNIGLAQAFIATGSQTVIASTRIVSDSASTRFSSLFYQHRADTKMEYIGRKFQKTQLTQRTQFHTDDWSSLRLYVP